MAQEEEGLDPGPRRVLVTGVGRRLGIAAAIVEELRADGWVVVTTGCRAYDEAQDLDGDLRIADFDADLADPEVPARLISGVRRDEGPLHGLVLCHAVSVDSSIATTTVESFDQHFAVNTRASWLLIQAFAAQFPGPAGSGRIVALTSDHTVGNLPLRGRARVPLTAS